MKSTRSGKEATDRPGAGPLAEAVLRDIAGQRHPGDVQARRPGSDEARAPSLDLRAPRTALGNPLDTKPYVRHHPVIGYQYVPNSQFTLPRPGGGTYSLKVNAAGIRSDREYAPEKPPGASRIIVLGDSYAAGQYLPNEQRFSELIERRHPDLEVINLALEGTGTDQQLLIYEEVGRKYEHDAVVILPFLQNIRRNLVEARVCRDPKTGGNVLLPKPRFELVGGPDGGQTLELRNVPVPEERQAVDEAGEALRQTDSETGLARRAKDGLSKLGLVRAAKKVVYPLVGYDPFPEYKRTDSPGWALMEAILRRLIAAADGRPVAIVPLFYVSYVRYRMGRNYWKRFSSLADGRQVHAIDVLPQFTSLGTDAVKCFQEPHDPHLSAHGHLVLADALEDHLATLLPRKS